MRAAPDSYGNLLATRQRNERVFAFGYTAGSLPGKSGCERTTTYHLPSGLPVIASEPHDAASSRGVNLE